MSKPTHISDAGATFDVYGDTVHRTICGYNGPGRRIVAEKPTCKCCKRALAGTSYADNRRAQGLKSRRGSGLTPWTPTNWRR